MARYSSIVTSARLSNDMSRCCPSIIDKYASTINRWARIEVGRSTPNSNISRAARSATLSIELPDTMAIGSPQTTHIVGRWCLKRSWSSMSSCTNEKLWTYSRAIAAGRAYSISPPTASAPSRAMVGLRRLPSVATKSVPSLSAQPM